MKFSDFGFKKIINDALDVINFLEPTTIQEKVIPLLKKNRSVIAQSHTGTGKTHAFLLPILNNLKYDISNKTQFVIMTPTRELARQIFANIKELTNNISNCSSSIFVGGDEIKKQIINLNNNQPTIVVGTPTRLKELYEQNALKITTASYVVIDECDMIFELGFIDEVDSMLSKMPKEINVSLFSATINNAIKPFLRKYLSSAIFVEDIQNRPSNKNIEHVLIWTKNKENKDVLHTIVRNINPFLAIIFVNRKTQVKEIIGWLQELGIKNIGELHGDLDPRQRTNMQKRIQNNEFKYIVASDIASRGIDINGVSHVISVELPRELDYYIHRSGRTGRHNYTGQSFVLHNSDNQFSIDELKSRGIKFFNKKLVNGELVDVLEKPAKKQTEHKTDLKTQNIINKYKNQKVKPGYKKKRKNEIETHKKKVRREHIKESIDKIKKAKYAKRRTEIFENE